MSREACNPQIRNVIPGSFEMRCKAPIDDRDDSRPKGETVSWYGDGENTHLSMA